jgi:hypothetical protein
MQLGRASLIVALSGALMAVTLCSQLPLPSQADDGGELIPESPSMDAASTVTPDKAPPSAETKTLYGSAKRHHGSADTVDSTGVQQSQPQALNAESDENKLQSEQAASGKAKAPLQGQVLRHASGVRSLPEGREPDVIIGHFSMSIGFFHVGVNGPIGNQAQLSSRLEKKWRGKQIATCELFLEKIKDGSGGYYFNTIGHSDGPRGWLMPMPKSATDKVRPWAIYYDQPDAVGVGSYGRRDNDAS